VRALRTVLGWIVTIGLLLAVVALALAEEVATPWLREELHLPAWGSWLIIGTVGITFLVLAIVVLVNPKQRAARREARERRQRLERFELDDSDRGEAR
jgi:hypothetical protein